jgi:hypothetical protein
MILTLSIVLLFSDLKFRIPYVRSLCYHKKLTMINSGRIPRSNNEWIMYRRNLDAAKKLEEEAAMKEAEEEANRQKDDSNANNEDDNDDDAMVPKRLNRKQSRHDFY